MIHHGIDIIYVSSSYRNFRIGKAASFEREVPPGGGNWYGAVISSAFCLVTSLKCCGWLRNPINHQKDETL